MLKTWYTSESVFPISVYKPEDHNAGQYISGPTYENTRREMYYFITSKYTGLSAWE
jgi:hypothetical protein